MSKDIDLVESVVKSQMEEQQQCSEVIDTIGIKELAQLLNDFSFCNSTILIDDDDTCFRITMDHAEVMFFSNGEWREKQEYVGMLISINRAFDETFMSKFNQQTIIGRLYTVDKAAGITIFRGDVHLIGGVTKRHIYMKIRAFVDCYKALSLQQISH